MQPKVRIEKRGLWDVTIEKYMSRKLLIAVAASALVFTYLINGWIIDDWLPWIEVTLSEDDKWLLEWLRPILYFYIGVQGGKDIAQEYTSYRSYESYVTKPKAVGEPKPADAEVSEEDELLSA